MERSRPLLRHHLNDNNPLGSWRAESISVRFWLASTKYRILIIIQIIYLYLIISTKSRILIIIQIQSFKYEPKYLDVNSIVNIHTNSY